MRPGAGEQPGEDRLDRRIDEEVRFHIEGRIEELIESGLSRAEAERRAVAAFGDVERVRTELRSIDETMEKRRRRREWAGGWLRDLRLGARRLRRKPGYALVSVLTLGLGIGASVAMFTVVNAVVLRPLPFPEPDRLVRLWPSANMNIAMSREVAEPLRTVTSYTGIAHWTLTLTDEGAATVIQAAAVDAGYFDVFGVQPLLGRSFVPEETDPSRSGVVLLSWGMWQSRFGGDRDVIGRRIRLSGYDHEDREVIGVMPEGHNTLNQDADAWIPLHLAAGRTVASDSSWYVGELVARLSPGATLEQVGDEVRAAAVRVRATYPGLIDESTVQSASAVRLIDSVVGGIRPMLWLLLAAVGLVLLIACANVANLALARSSGQRQELAVQTALGASRMRLIRHLLTESVVIAALGGLAGALLARVMLAIVRVAESSGLPRATDLGTDWRVFAFATAASIGALIVFGVLPAALTTRGVLQQDLREGGRGGSRGRRTHRLNRSLVTVELAVATVLTTAAALVMAAFVSLRATDPGIDTSDVLEVMVQPPADRYSNDSHTALLNELATTFGALPGVESVGAIHLLPFTENNWSFPYLAEGHAPPEDGPLPSANFREITPGYLDAVDLELLRGRDFTSADRAGSPRVLLVNRTFAELLWPGEDPVGRRIAVFGSMQHEIVGVVADVHQHALDRAPLPEMYVPMAQWNQGGATAIFMLEGPGALELVSEARAAVAAIDADVPVTEVRPLSDALDASLARQRFTMLVLASFGVLALVLGGLGVHGVLSNLVGSRLGDFGIQLALGASRRSIMREALATGIAPALFGLALGIAGSLAAAGLIRRLAGEGGQGYFLAVLVVAGGVLFAVSVLASWLPARRASRADPLSVLRSG